MAIQQIFGTVRQDLQYGVRLLLRRPAFGITAILVLSIGIGTTTGVFSIINAVMLKPLPVAQPEELTLLFWSSAHWAPTYKDYSGSLGCPDRPVGISGCSFSYPLYAELASSRQLFSEVIASAGLAEVTVFANGRADHMLIEPVSGSYFSGLGVQSILGRTIAADDDLPSRAAVAVISETLWDRRFGRDPSAIGSNARINGATFTIIGVLPKRFMGLQNGIQTDLWIPIASLPMTGIIPSSAFVEADRWWLTIVGRLKPSVSVGLARSALDVAFRRSLPKVTGSDQLPGIELLSMRTGLSALIQQYSTQLFVLQAATTLLLLLACANVATLAAANLTERTQEIVVRVSLGADRNRLARQLITENAVLTILAAVPAWAMANVLTTALARTLAAGPLPVRLDLSADGVVMGFVVALCVLTWLLFGVIHPIRRTVSTQSLAVNRYGGGGSRRLFRTTTGPNALLVGGQVALSLTVVIVAGLLLRTFVNLKTVDLGFDSRKILLFSLDLAPGGGHYDHVQRYTEALRTNLGTLPGVTSVSFSEMSPLSGSVRRGDFVFRNPAQVARDRSVTLEVFHVGPEFFQTMGVPVHVGRTIQLDDSRNNRLVAVVNEEFVRRYDRQGSPVGASLSVVGRDNVMFPIVGVVGDAKFISLRSGTAPAVYLPFRYNRRPGTVHFELQATAANEALFAGIRRVVEQLDNTLPILHIKRQSEQIDEMLTRERALSILSGAFAVLSLLLACTGLYSSLTYSVAARTKEIGIRMALGAAPWTVLRMVLRETFGIVGVGMIIGIAGVLLLGPLLSRLLFGVKPADPFTVVSSMLALLVVAGFAGFLPAYHASSLAPLDAIREP